VALPGIAEKGGFPAAIATRVSGRWGNHRLSAAPQGPQQGSRGLSRGPIEPRTAGVSDSIDDAKAAFRTAWEAHSMSLSPFGSFTPRMRKNKMRAKISNINQGAKR
jgi:hypothetical protein